MNTLVYYNLLHKSIEEGQKITFEDIVPQKLLNFDDADFIQIILDVHKIDNIDRDEVDKIKDTNLFDIKGINIKFWNDKGSCFYDYLENPIFFKNRLMINPLMLNKLIFNSVNSVIRYEKLSQIYTNAQGNTIHRSLLFYNYRNSNSRNIHNIEVNDFCCILDYFTEFKLQDINRHNGKYVLGFGIAQQKRF